MACLAIRARLKSQVTKRAKTQGQLYREWVQQRATDQGDRIEEKQILYK